MPPRKNKSFIEVVSGLPFLTSLKKLEFYPPFYLMGVKFLHVSKDSRKLHARLPLKWYSRNLNGTMFGGNMASLADPLPAVMCGIIFPGTTVWSKEVHIEFIRPGSTDLDMYIEITDAHIEKIRKDLDESGRSDPEFTFYYFDKSGTKVAKVRNVASVRKNKKV